MKDEMVRDSQEAVAPAQASINRDAPGTRLVAGLSVPDGPLITAAIDYAQRLSEPYLFNHAMRSWLFAEADWPHQGNRLRSRGRRDWHDPP